MGTLQQKKRLRVGLSNAVNLRIYVLNEPTVYKSVKQHVRKLMFRMFAIYATLWEETLNEEDLLKVVKCQVLTSHNTILLKMSKNYAFKKSNKKLSRKEYRNSEITSKQDSQQTLRRRLV